jgi:hypothetical protein
MRDEMGSAHFQLLDTQIRRSSIVEVLTRLYELRTELQRFLSESSFELKTYHKELSQFSRLAYSWNILTPPPPKSVKRWSRDL